MVTDGVVMRRFFECPSCHSDREFKQGERSDVFICASCECVVKLNTATDSKEEQNIKAWLKEICRGGYRDQFVHIVEDRREDPPRSGYFECYLYTDRFRYRIVATDERGVDSNGYLGCRVSVRKPRAGEDHFYHRGNDLPDGPYNRETWQKIKNAILAHELVKIAKGVRNVREPHILDMERGKEKKEKPKADHVFEEINILNLRTYLPPSKGLIHKLFHCPTFWRIKPFFKCAECGKRYRCYWDGHDIKDRGINICNECTSPV